MQTSYLINRTTFPSFLRRQLRRNATSSVITSVINVKNIPAPHSGSIRILALNRPQARNAISKQLLSELSAHVTAVENEAGHGPTRVLIVASNVDSSFCAGADLKERVGFSKQEYLPRLGSFHVMGGNLLSLILEPRISFPHSVKPSPLFLSSLFPP